MLDDTLYITPHEAALAVVATAMKKARLRLGTLIIDSIIGGILFSAGGMLCLCVQAENPSLWGSNPGIVHLMQGLAYSFSLFYVFMMGGELFNSNVLFFPVALCRGAVNIFDLLINWSVSWVFNLGANLFVCYVICHLSGLTESDLYRRSAIDIAMVKYEPSFIQTFIKGCAASFCVCLALYLQLMAKPYHVKLLLMSLPVITFISLEFNHVVADMFLVPMGMIEGAPISVGGFIWKILIPATLGNIVGGSFFGIIITFYLHLVVVEGDRALLNLPKFEARDEQPELEMDSRVVRVRASTAGTDPCNSNPGEKSGDCRNPMRYIPPNASSDTQRQPKVRNSSRRSHLSTNKSLISRSPPGVFPVMGMGTPQARERTIAGGAHMTDDSSDTQSICSRDDLSILGTNRKETRHHQREEEGEDNVCGYNSRENGLGETLKRFITHSNKPETNNPQDIEMGLSRTCESSTSNTSSRVLRSLQRTFSRRNTETSDELLERLRRHGITRTAANASDNIAGIENYEFDVKMKRPSPAELSKSQQSTNSGAPLSPIQCEHSVSEKITPDTYEGSDQLTAREDPEGKASTRYSDQGDEVSSSLGAPRK